MAVPQDEVFEPVPDKVTDTDDGGAIVQISDEEGTNKTYEFYDNIVEMLPEDELTRLATRLQKSIENDKKSRERRDKEYAEAIKRTGLGQEAPGGDRADQQNEQDWQEGGAHRWENGILMRLALQPPAARNSGPAVGDRC